MKDNKKIISHVETIKLKFKRISQCLEVQLWGKRWNQEYKSRLLIKETKDIDDKTKNRLLEENDLNEKH